VKIGTLILGDNEIADCDAALVMDGEEVFRLRERSHDGQLVVDFDLRDHDDARLARIAKSHVVYCAPGVQPRSRPGRYEVVRINGGDSLAVVEGLSPTSVRVTGTFFVRGWKVESTTNGVRLGGMLLTRNRIQGCGKAIELRRGSMAIGIAER
jgi:hypothetical protein